MKHSIIALVMLVLPQISLSYNFTNILDFYSPVEVNHNLLKEKKFRNRIIASIPEIPENYHKNVMFWRDVYSYFDSKHILIHSKADLSNIFKVVNLEELYKREKNPIVAEIKKNKLMRAKVNNVKNEINKCYQQKKCELSINLSIPKRNLFKNIRTQTGQLDILKKGINRYSKYQNTIENVIHQTNSDPEWIAIPFLESSFNTKAVSKVGATGAWQIMKYVGKRLLPINKYIDARRNPVLSAYAGLKILRQNRIITRNDDISIIAYNSGLRNYFKIRKKLKKKKISTEEYLHLSKKKNKSFDFASENFLLEYLAMKDFLKANNIIRDTRKRQISSKANNLNLFQPYVSKCNTRPSRVISLLSKKNKLTKYFNNHFRKKYINKILPPGQIYLSDVELPKEYYKKVRVKNLDDMAPIGWKANQINCSII